jgi:WD40 repeat protein
VSNPGDPSRWRRFTPRIADPFANSSQFLAFAPDGRTLLVGAGADLQLYDVATLKEIVPTDGHHCALEYVAFSADGKRLLTSGAKDNFNPQEVATWDVLTWQRLQLSSTRPPQWPNIRVASSDHSYYVGNQGNDRFNLYNMADGKLLGRFQVPGKQSSSVVGFFSPDSRFYVQSDFGPPTFEPGDTRLYTVPSCKLLCRLTSLPYLALYRPDMFPLAFSADEELVALSDWQDGLIHVVETSSGKVRQRLGPGLERKRVGEYFDFQPGTLAFSPDGKLLAAWSPDQPVVRIWDLATGKERLQLPPDGDKHLRMTLAWSSDGRTLAVGDQRIQLWEVAAAKIRHEFTGHEGEIRSLAFSPDGRLLASGSADTTVLIWDVWGR